MLPTLPQKMSSTFTLLFFLLQCDHATSQLNQIILKGCFSSSGGMADQGPYTYQTSGYCQKICVGINKPAMALTGGGDCLCGDLLPPPSAKVDDSKCSTPCNGYNLDYCGGNDFYTVALTGTSNNVGTAPDNNSPPPAPSNGVLPPMTQLSTIPPSVVTIGGSTIVSTVPGSTATIERPASGVAASETSPPNPASTPHESPGVSTGGKVGITVGVLVGALGFTALVAAAFFFYKRRKSPLDESHHRHNASVNPFASAGSAPAESSLGSSHGAPAGQTGSCEDSRLDKGMVEHKRQSDNSVFDDSTDYSRRILKVTNPENSE